jgi:hypothetical protein
VTTPAKRLGRNPLVAQVVMVIVLAVGVTLYQNNIAGQIRDAQLKGCERGKLDRTANAKAFRAQSDYLNLVLQAKSVHADVKRAARVNQRTQDESATSLESRTGSNLDCAKAVR